MIYYCFTGATQSNDIGPIADADSDAVLNAKKTVIETIGSWIRTP